MLRCLQAGHTLSLPHSRPMSVIGPRCHELRINDEGATWRIIYRTDADAVLILDVFQKKASKTPPAVIENYRLRARNYDQDAREEGRDG